MPGQAFLMTGMGASFRPAGPCPVMDGPHCAPDDDGSWMVADAATRDQSATVRLVLWRCRFCGVQVTGIGHTGVLQPGQGEGVDVQEFTWLEAAPALKGPIPLMKEIA